MDLVISSYLDKSLLPIERVKRIFTALYSLRYWRRWLTCDKVYSVSKHFISSSAYLSIEINGQVLLLAIRKFRIENTPEGLVTWLIGSQQCESFFRSVRSLCPVGLNKPNLTEGEFLDRARKADANLLLQQQGSKDGIIYRRDEKKKNRSGGSTEALKSTTLPTDEELFSQLRECMQIAKKKMNDLGIYLTGSDVDNFAFDRSYGKRIRSNKIPDSDLQDENEEDVALEDDDEDDLLNQDSHDMQVCGPILQMIHEAKFRDFSQYFSSQPTCSEENEDGPSVPSAFVKIPDADGNMRLVQISTVCWLLENGMQKMSNDRVLRVRQLASFNDSRRLAVTKVEVRNTVRIGDWCLFKSLSGRNREYLFLLGRVIQFQAIDSSVASKREIYEWSCGTDGIGVNCTWYMFDGQTKQSRSIASTGKQLAVLSHGFHPCDTYICSMPTPEIPSCKNVFFSAEVVNDVLPFLSKIK